MSKFISMVIHPKTIDPQVTRDPGEDVYRDICRRLQELTVTEIDFEYNRQKDFGYCQLMCLATKWDDVENGMLPIVRDHKDLVFIVWTSTNFVENSKVSYLFVDGELRDKTDARKKKE